jgi:TRAP-type mannitol/chloroaromatic compound transport system permease small subunit
MPRLLALARWIDRLNQQIGRALAWLVLLAVLVSAGNAVMRYGFKLSSNAWLELQWYLVSAVFLLCAGYTLLHQQHVKIDIVYNRWSRRVQLYIDLFGTLVFLLPMAGLVVWLSWPVFVDAFRSGEVSANTGGLTLWWARLLVPVGFALLWLQGVSELIKRVAVLREIIPDTFRDAAPAVAPPAPTAPQELSVPVPPEEARFANPTESKP